MCRKDCIILRRIFFNSFEREGTSVCAVSRHAPVYFPEGPIVDSSEASYNFNTPGCLYCLGIKLFALYFFNSCSPLIIYSCWGFTLPLSLLLLLLLFLCLFCCTVAFTLRQLIARRQLIDLAMHENTKTQGGIMKEPSSRRNHEGGIIMEESPRRNHQEGIVKEES